MKRFYKILILCCALITIFSLCSCSAGDKSAYDTVKQTKMDNFTLLNDTAKHGQIVMTGDSIVELYPTYEMFPAFPDAVNPLFVYNRGISGDMTPGLKNRFQDNILKIAPRIVSILIGTNDISAGITKETAVQNIREMIAAAKTAGVEKIVLQSIYPVNHAVNPSMVGRRKNETIQEWNEAYRALCAETGAVYADVFETLQDADGNFNVDFTYDGLHPNAKGYIVLTAALSPYLNPEVV